MRQQKHFITACRLSSWWQEYARDPKQHAAIISCLFELSKTLRRIPNTSSAILAVNAQFGVIFVEWYPWLITLQSRAICIRGKFEFTDLIFWETLHNYNAAR